jgi:hypothetical protein
MSLSMEEVKKKPKSLCYVALTRNFDFLPVVLIRRLFSFVWI